MATGDEGSGKKAGNSAGCVGLIVAGGLVLAMMVPSDARGPVFAITAVVAVVVGAAMKGKGGLGLDLPVGPRLPLGEQRKIPPGWNWAASTTSISGLWGEAGNMFDATHFRDVASGKAYGHLVTLLTPEGGRSEGKYLLIKLLHPIKEFNHELGDDPAKVPPPLRGEFLTTLTKWGGHGHKWGVRNGCLWVEIGDYTNTEVGKLITPVAINLAKIDRAPDDRTQSGRAQEGQSPGYLQSAGTPGGNPLLSKLPVRSDSSSRTSAGAASAGSSLSTGALAAGAAAAAGLVSAATSATVTVTQNEPPTSAGQSPTPRVTEPPPPPEPDGVPAPFPDPSEPELPEPELAEPGLGQELPDLVDLPDLAEAGSLPSTAGDPGISTTLPSWGQPIQIGSIEPLTLGSGLGSSLGPAPQIGQGIGLPDPLATPTTSTSWTASSWQPNSSWQPGSSLTSSSTLGSSLEPESANESETPASEVGESGSDQA